MTTPTVAPTTRLLDLRVIAPSDRHALIFQRFDSLRDGESLELLNDHDPQPLRRHFDLRSPGQVAWNTLTAGPAEWRVQVTRVASSKPRPGDDSCCSGGACCG